jgi:hypothetical protein
MTIIGKILLAGIAFCVLASSVAAQNAKTMREQLIGSWDMVSAVVTVDGTQGEVFGPHPQGMLIFERNGRFVQIEITPGLAKFTSNSRDTGTPEENKADVTETLAFYGTWSVDEGARTVTYHVVAGTYPNFNGVDLKRLVTTLDATDLVWTNPTPSQGSGSGHVAWKRVK